MAKTEDKSKKAAKEDEPMKVQIVEGGPDTPPAAPPQAFPDSEPLPAVKSPLTNAVVKTTERVTIREIETGEESVVHPVDAREAVATGRFEVVTDDMPQQLPNDEVPTVVTGVSEAVVDTVPEEDQGKEKKK